MITKSTLLISAILFGGASIHAQNTGLSVNDSTVQTDSLLRGSIFTTEGEALDVALQRVVEDSLLIVNRGLVQSISINSIHSITVHTNRTRLVLGAVIGAVVGGVSGGIIGGDAYEEPAPVPGAPFNINFSRFDRFVHAAVGTILGILIGGSVGGLIEDADKVDDVYDLSSMTLPGKVRLIQYILASEIR